MAVKTAQPAHAPGPDGPFEDEQPQSTLGQQVSPIGDDGQVVDVTDADIVEGPTQAQIEAVERAVQYAANRGLMPSATALIKYIAARAMDTQDVSTVVLEQLAVRIMNADNPDQILDPFGATKGGDLIGKPLMVVGCQFLESAFSEGFPWYVTFMVKDDHTERTTPVTVGGEKVVMQAAGLDYNDMWPQYVLIHKAEKPTAGGFYPYDLRSADKR